MKLTPLDIHHKEFRHSLRGYAEEEVDQFLDDVADEFERLFKENIDLSERLEAANEKVKTYVDMEKTLHNTMVAAQRSAEDIVGAASDDAAAMLKDAEVKAKEVIHNALTEKHKVQGELVRIKQAEQEFRARFKEMLETHLHSVKELALPEDVQVIVGETAAGSIGEVRVAESSAMAAASGIEPESQPAPDVTSVPPKTEASTSQPTVAMPPVGNDRAPSEQPELVEPPSSGFVTSVNLGEMTDPEVEPETPELIEPAEFGIPSFDSLGEREVDIDIEEID